MAKRSVTDWINEQTINKILICFSSPKTPRQVEKELGIKKLKLKPFLEKNLLQSLNPEARKGRFYIVTSKAKKLIELPCSNNERNNDWNLIGWIISSPKQRHVILKTIDSKKRTSEEIRERAYQLNPHLTRISTKAILKELINKGLIETEINERKRYYWIVEKGKLIVSQLH
jgi:predicted transcriptional regulator